MKEQFINTQLHKNEEKKRFEIEVTVVMHLLIMKKLPIK